MLEISKDLFGWRDEAGWEMAIPFLKLFGWTPKVDGAAQGEEYSLRCWTTPPPKISRTRPSTLAPSLALLTPRFFFSSRSPLAHARSAAINPPVAPPKQAQWAAAMSSLQDRIAEEWRRREKKGSSSGSSATSGLLAEMQAVERAKRDLNILLEEMAEEEEEAAAREVEVDLLTPTQGDGAAQIDGGHGSATFLELPGELFAAENALAWLALGRCSLRAVPPGAAGLAGIRSLSLSNTDVTDEAVRAVLSNCRSLEFLSLRSCHLLTSVRIVDGKALRGLELVGCLAVRELVVAAPALESFAFHGDVVCLDDAPPDGVKFGATPALRDAYLSHLGFGDYDDGWHEFAYSNFLEDVAHASSLTLCSVGLLLILPLPT